MSLVLINILHLITLLNFNSMFAIMYHILYIFKIMYHLRVCSSIVYW